MKKGMKVLRIGVATEVSVGVSYSTMITCTIMSGGRRKL